MSKPIIPVIKRKTPILDMLRGRGILAQKVLLQKTRKAEK